MALRNSYNLMLLHDTLKLEIRYQTILPLLDRYTRASQDVKRIDPNNDENLQHLKRDIFKH